MNLQRTRVSNQNIHSQLLPAVDDVMALLRRGSQQRTTAATAANAQSSRSHSIFTADIETVLPAEDGLTRVRFSRLNLVDLAGTAMLSTLRWICDTAVALTLTIGHHVGNAQSEL